MTARIIHTSKFTLSFLFLYGITLFSTPTYQIQLKDNVVDNNKREVTVTIRGEGEGFGLTSYQCAFSINQSIDFSNHTFKYIPGSSELVNEPNLYVGIINIDGETELTFVSFIGNDQISSSKETVVGKFLLEGTDIGKVKDIKLKWNFEGTISTIITGKSFENITNPLNHTSDYTLLPEAQQVVKKVGITNSEASAVYGNIATDKMLYDGISSSTSNNPSSNGRWAVEGFPQWVTIDLGEETDIDYIKLDPYYSENGVSYDCEFYSGSYSNKSLIKKETTQTDSQWSEHKLGGVKTRYITVVITGSKGNDWCDIWEMEVYGVNSTSSVEDEEEVTEDTVPSEYGISQNYPNPFNPTTKIEVTMKEVGSARLDVYNILGEKVLAVLDEELSAGSHTINIDGTRLASGTYIYQLVVNNQFSQTKKMNLIK